MTNSINTHALQKRNFHLDEETMSSAAGNWYREKPLTTQLLNSYTLLIPNGESFIIRTCNQYIKQVTPELADELRMLFFQEGSHSREHGHLLKIMQAEGLGLNLYRKLCNLFFYKFLEPLTPLKIRLATAAAIEHHNAIIATFFLNQELLNGVQNTELRKLFLWHFAEEIEHKETVYKLLQSVSNSWLIRMLGLVSSLGTFIFSLLLGAFLFGIRTGSIATSSFWKELLKETLGRNSFLAVLIKGSFEFLRPNFYPSIKESSALLNLALDELERLEGKSTRTQFPPPCNIPPKFKSKMMRTMGKFFDYQSKYPFFFSNIDNYDGSWIVSKGKKKLNLCTYSYLGLLQHPLINAAATEAIERYGTGTHGVRLLGGNLNIHEQIESVIANFFQREAAITFSSGFMTNLAVIGCFAGKGDYIFTDEFNHASIADGCRFSRAEVVRFSHNNVSELAEKLEKVPVDARKLIVVDAVYSMDGDIAPLMELIKLRDRYENTILMVDEAHSLGVLGNNGRGIEEHFGCIGKIDILMGTLSKAIPCQGGYITGSHELVTYLRYNARGFIFSAAISPATSAAACAAFKLIEQEGKTRRSQLMSNVNYFIRRLKEENFNVGNSQTAIVPIMMGDEKTALDMALKCNQEGIYVMPVLFPAVPKGTERLRMNVTFKHGYDELDYAINALLQARNQVMKHVNFQENYHLYPAQVHNK